MITKRELQISVNVDPACTSAWTDETLARAIVCNLVGNAVHHASKGGRINVSVAFAGGVVQLIIVNDCEHGESTDVQKLCDPFWSCSESRSNGRQGLGLSLVREYARVLGAPLGLSVTEAGKFRASIEFPTATSPAMTSSDGALTTAIA